MNKRRRSSKNLKLKIYFFVVVTGIVLLLSMDMYQKFKIDLILKDLHRLEQRKRQLISETEMLKSDVDQLRNIDRITNIAQNKLGLVPNGDPVIVLKVEDLDQVEKLKAKFAQKNQQIKKYKLAGVN